jgi:signal transduction histidine kinase/HAMP domain-containing protein
VAFLTNLSLRKKVVLMAAVGLIAGVGLFSFLSMQALDQSTEAMLQERLTTTHLIADYADEVLRRALAELTDFTQALEEHGWEQEIEQRIDDLEGAYSGMSISTLGIFLVDREGRVMWSKPEYPDLALMDMSAYPGIGPGTGNGEASISGLVSAPVTETPAVLLISSNSDGEGESGYALVVAIDLVQSSIGGFIQPIELGLTGYVEIVDQEGVVIARTLPGRELAPFEKSDHPDRFAALISAGDPTVGTCHTCHEAGQHVERRDVLAFAPLSAAPWGVVIRQSEEEALAPTRDLRQKLLFSGVGLVAATLVIVGIVMRDVVGRIRVVTSASQRIAEGDLTSSVAQLGRDEIGSLARTLDDMRVKLHVSYNDLEQRTKELSSLLTVSEILTSTVGLPGILEAVVAKAVEVIPGADGGALILESGEEGRLTTRAVAGLSLAVPLDIALVAHAEPLSLLVSGQADEEAKAAARAICVSFLQLPEVGVATRSAMCSPLVHEGKCIGSLVMVSRRDAAAFSESDLRLLQAIADYLDMTLERARLAEDAEEARALREADHLKSQFISSMSHELRTPLTSIKGYSSSLLREDASWDDETRHEFIEIIDEKADELRDLIDKLLQMARLEAGAMRPQKEPVLIPRLAQKVVEEAAGRSKKHEFVMELPADLPVVEADVRHLEQILSNLVENAVKYSPEGGRIVIRGALDHDRVVIGVGDEGEGISTEHHDKVFERFYRVDDPSTRGTPGSGLGLSIAKGHVEAHDGEIWLESAIGKGSTFYFTLPLEGAEVGE